jgi:hypothetical protein
MVPVDAQLQDVEAQVGGTVVAVFFGQQQADDAHRCCAGSGRRRYRHVFDHLEAAGASTHTVTRTSVPPIARPRTQITRTQFHTMAGSGGRTQ